MTKDKLLQSRRSAIGIFLVRRSPRLLHITEEIYLDLPYVRVRNKFLCVQEVA